MQRRPETLGLMWRTRGRWAHYRKHLSCLTENKQRGLRFKVQEEKNPTENITIYYYLTILCTYVDLNINNSALYAQRQRPSIEFDLDMWPWLSSWGNENMLNTQPSDEAYAYEV